MCKRRRICITDTHRRVPRISAKWIGERRGGEEKKKENNRNGRHSGQPPRLTISAKALMTEKALYDRRARRRTPRAAYCVNGNTTRVALLDLALARRIEKRRARVAPHRALAHTGRLRDLRASRSRDRNRSGVARRTRTYDIYTRAPTLSRYPCPSLSLFSHCWHSVSSISFPSLSFYRSLFLQ